MIYRIKNAGYRTVIMTFLVICVTGLNGYSQTIPLISPDQFTRISVDFSEEQGFFSNDNWVSNETSYLSVLDQLYDLDIRGDAYIGVGPNQNFTYIANIKPDIAFIVDIRKQNTLQHLIYKVLFELADSRAEFFSLLFSKPLDPESGPDESSGISQIVYYFFRAPSDPKLFNKTFKTIEHTLTQKYSYPLTDKDRETLYRIFNTFFIHNLEVTYNGNAYSWFPTYSQFLQAIDGNNRQRNPFNSREEYLYLRNMHKENRIIPVTGNFGGNKALKKIANFLTANNMKVSAFYVSNVEQYLLRDWNVWLEWVDNVKSLPVTEESVFIRWTYQRSYWSNRSYGLHNDTRLQWIKTFIENFDNDRYKTYSDLVLLDYIK